jgi:hypothetical protein
MHQKEY